MLSMQKESNIPKTTFALFYIPWLDGRKCNWPLTFNSLAQETVGPHEQSVQAAVSNVWVNAMTLQFIILLLHGGKNVVLFSIFL